ncbi:MAG: ribbon-helix-helix domain-containing protein [Candidatus Accumulibacter sp.]|jgi:hypothetical protein|nr:ribbon-helix-helix domain-containing protein [Accumulibacter sp.]
MNTARRNVAVSPEVDQSARVFIAARGGALGAWALIFNRGRNGGRVSRHQAVSGISFSAAPALPGRLPGLAGTIISPPRRGPSS